MSADEYWNSDPYLFRGYVAAQKLRNERKNEEMWLHGIYIMEAVATVMSDKKHKHKYPTKPLDIIPKEKDPQTERQKIIDYFNRLKERFDGRSSKKNKN